MADLIRISNWARLFEVSAAARAWEPGQKKRAGPLKYVRHQPRGANWTPSYRRMLRVAKGQGPAVYGVYWKLVELAALHDSEHRGAIWREPGRPATIQEIADELTGFSVRSIEKALEVLSHQDVAWISIEAFPENPGIPGKSGTLLEEKLREVKDKDKVKEPGKSGTPRQSSSEPPILTILLRGQTKTWNLTTEVLVQHIEAYPALDVLSEFKNMRGWSERMSTSKREVKGWTSRGALAGIRRWLEGEVESPSKNGAHGRQSWTKDERWKAFRKALPDWPKEKLRWACMTAKEKMEHESARIEGEEEDQAIRAAAAGKRKSSGGPVAIGTLAGESLRKGTE